MKESVEIKEQSPGENLVDAAVVECEVCGTQMYDLHCKISCPNCGYRRDCSDP